ncbi:SH3 and multiple ankyrin repeat domains protein 2-like isoform X3 [Ruditapes philippinarum]|uniref:SH3 and multiple ankyrin repeat domains protein 2-like isoform X3 n=1 Tax=Ruditapes philippinarum TaxID=129788 RepID=UPI00295A6E1F|nr:SH3 and multiple ankyrin repeat domains protein 2-like isoform X3 [Ruditapes philippinarum]XP_060600301.1 SH3 and multiple ankyrin repeat domains protein 2-like isoform X3 [Ruditapes philippinarum]
MSQKAIKKRTKDSFKKSVRIPVEPLDGKSRRPPGPLPQKSFPLNKFIALPNGLRPKSGQNIVDESPRRNIPIKAVAVPPGTSLNDSRASVYVIGRPQATTDVTSEAYVTSNSPDHVLHNITLPSQHIIVDRSVRVSRSDIPDATSTPRVPRRTEPRGYYSAQNSPRSSTPYGSINSNDSFASCDSRKRRYQKRSQSAPAENRSRLRDTDYVIKKWSEYDQIPGLIHKVPQDRDLDSVSIISENWSSAKVGIYPNGVVRTIYRSNSVNSGHSVNSFNTSSIGSSRSISELEFTDVCKVNPTFHDNNIEANNVSVQNWDFVRNDTHGNQITSVNSQNYNDIKWEDIPGLNFRKTVKTEPQIESVHKLSRSLSDYNLDNLNMEERTRRMSQSSIATSVGTSVGKSFTVNGIPQSGIVIRTPGKEKVFVNDFHAGVPGTSGGQEFYTVGRKSGTLMQSKLKFSSMPTLLDSKGDKKLMKLLKKQEKEERKRKEKEEKKRAKEEKKRLKMEKKLKTKTLPRNFQYQNGNILSPAMDNVYRRPMLSLSAVPIDIEDGQESSTGSSHTPAPNMAPPPLPEPSQRTMSLYASAPDLLRIEQVYGATLRGNNKDNHYRPPIPTSSDYGPRTVVLQRASEGYGFVLRGAKSQLKPSGELDFRPTAEFPALQYLDSVDPGSVSDRAGLKGGDFILEINGENVVRASHDRVVHLIRSTGDTLAMKVVTVKPASRSQDWFVHQDKSLTMPNRKKKAPAPPQRDPRTSLSMSRSEGQAISDEMAAMDKLDEAIQSQKEAEEKKTASIRSRTAAKRVSCVDMDNIGIDGKLEKSKSRSTPDLLENESKLRKNIIYATPTVPDKKSSEQKNVYTVQVGNVPSSPTGVQMRPKGPPPPPPEETNSPKKKAPKPPKSESGDSSSSEVVTINTSKQSPYASVKVLTNKVDSPDSPYESSFRPGASAKLSEEPSAGSGHKSGHQRTPSAGAVLVKESDKQNVSFAEDKVLDHAAGFLKKHPNAKLLITAEGKEKLKKRNSSLYEPEPDYDSDSGEEKPNSPVRIRDPKKQSVTVISVGEKSTVAPPQTKRYTIHTSIPSEEKFSAQPQGFVIPPRPDGPAPVPPAPGSQSPKQRKSAAPAPPTQSSQVMTVKAEVNVQLLQRQQDIEESEAPPLPETPPPDFETTPSPRQIPSQEAAAAPPPPPPPPPPPAPSYDQIIKSKSVVKADYIAPVTVPTDAIAAAVAKRQERMQNEGIKMTEQKPKSSSPANIKDSNQAAILAAVAKRREKLEQQSESSVIDDIESRLQKTKKLQAARFQLAGAKSTKKETDTKTNNNANGISQNKLNFKVQSIVNKTGPATKEAATKEEFSFKVKPVNVTGLSEIKPKFTPKPLSKQTSVTNSAKVNTQESLKIKPTPLEKATPLGVVKSDSKINAENRTLENSEKVNNEKNVNGQSDYIALAEKRRQEWLQRKQKSSESKSSSPEKEKLQTKTIEIKPVNNKDKSPPVSAKPKLTKSGDQAYTEFQSPQGLVKVKAVTNMNGDIDKNGTTADLNNIPPPPPGFRDGGNIENTVVQLEIIPPPANFSSDSGTDMSQQHSPAFSPDTASLVSSLSTLSSLSGDGRGNGYDDVIAPPPPGFDDGDSSVIPPPPEFGNDNGKFKKTGKTYNDKPVDEWLCNDVLDWLDSLSMSQYKPSFQRNCIDGKKLVALSRNNYIDLGVTQVGHRMNLERSIKKAAIRQNNVSDNIVASERL